MYDVSIPENTEVYDCDIPSAPHGVFRSNRIIISNPRPVTDEMAMYFYEESILPEKSYYKAMAGCAIRGYRNTCLAIIKDKVNKNNIDLVLNEIDDFVSPYGSDGAAKNGKEVYEEIMKILYKIKEN